MWFGLNDVCVKERPPEFRQGPVTREITEAQWHAEVVFKIVYYRN